MIYTVTLNPSIDYTVRLERVNPGETNRALNTEYTAGGKGINVSRMLGNLETESCALGFTAGRMGDLFETLAGSYGFKTDFIRLPQGETRVNVKIKSDIETELNAAGPEADGTAAALLLKKLGGLLAGDVLVLAGSILPGIKKDIYAQIMQSLEGRGVSIAVDTTGESLMQCLQHHPFLVKPNGHELGALFNTEIRGVKDAFYYGERLYDLGASYVIVSLGSDGAVLICEEGRYYIAAPEGTAVNSVGAGDSMVAGFIRGMMDGRGVEHAFRLAAACGSASTFSCEFAAKNDVKSIYNLLTLQ